MRQQRVNIDQQRAWEIHREAGHPPRYDGPCWGPTPEERRQASDESLTTGPSEA